MKRLIALAVTAILGFWAYSATTAPTHTGPRYHGGGGGGMQASTYDVDGDGYVDSCNTLSFYLSDTNVEPGNVGQCVAADEPRSFTSCTQLIPNIKIPFTSAIYIDSCAVFLTDNAADIPSQDPPWDANDEIVVEFRENSDPSGVPNTQIGSTQFSFKTATECGTDANCLDAETEVIEWVVSSTSANSSGVFSIVLDTFTDPGGEIDLFEATFICRICGGY